MRATRMRTAVWLAGLLTAGAAVAAPAKPKKLADFLPLVLGDAKRDRLKTVGSDAFGAYLLPEQRFVNVNLMWVKELAADKAAFRVHKPGETQTNRVAHLSHEGFDVNGVFVQRTQFLNADGQGTGQSDAIALLADRLVVRVSVERARDPNEPVEWMRKLDLRGLAALKPPKNARQAPPPVSDADLLNTRR